MELLEFHNLMLTSFIFFNEGNLDLAYDALDEAIMESDVHMFYAWWLTETNPEYSLTSTEFLGFISDYCKILKLYI